MSDAVAAESILGENGTFQDGWLDNMPEGTFEKDDTGALKQGDLKDHKNFGSVCKSYIDTQKLVSSSIQPLPEKPTADQIKAHRTKVGCPDTVEGYEVVAPDMPEGMAYDDALVKKCTQ